MTSASKTTLEDFSRFISHQSHFLRQFPQLIHQQAFNESSRPHVKAAAEAHLAQGKLPHRPWLRKTAGAVRPRHSGEVISLAFWGDERHLVVSTDTREVWVWDIDAGELQFRCDAPPSAARSLTVSPNGKLLAGGFGAPQPNPFISGVWVWESDGKFNREFRPYEWVYTVRWVDDQRLIAGAGTPIGADAGGSLWIANLATDECRKIPVFLSDRPVVLAWNASRSNPGSQEALITLIKDGSLRRVASDGSITASAAVERPAASVVVDSDTFCIANKEDVFEITLHQRDERFHVSKKTLGRSGILRKSVIDHPICLASHPARRLLAVGTGTGEAWIISLDGAFSPQRIHKSDAPVTAAAFSATGDRLAVGDMLGRVFAYSYGDRSQLFHTAAVRELIAGRVDGARAMMLYPDRLEIAGLDDPGRRTSVELSESLNPQDFDVVGRLGMVLSCASTTDAITTGSVIQIIDVSRARVTQLFDVPSGADALAEAETLIMPSYFERIRLQPARDGCQVLLGSKQGIMVYPLLGFGSGEPFVVPSIASDSGLLDPNTPSIWCNGFEIDREREDEVAARYANKVGSPHFAQGDFRVWRIGDREPSCSPRLSSPVRSICLGAGGEVIAGTEDGDASCWRFDEEWRIVAGVAHGAPVVAVCRSHSGLLACSASLDGSLVVWDMRDGRTVLRTFEDLQPIAAGFTPGDHSLCLIDLTGEVHLWEIEQIDAIDGLSDGDQPSDSHGDDPIRFDDYFALAESLGGVKSRIDQGDYAGASETLSALRESPALALVKDDWLLRITLAEQRSLLPDPIKQGIARLEAISREITDGWLRQRASDRESELPECLKALIEVFRRLVEEGNIIRAKALATALPQSPNGVLGARRSMLDIIPQVEAKAEFERAVGRAKELIEKGDINSAREVIEALGEDPENVLEAKHHLLEQLRQIEGGRGEVEAEIETILDGLAEAGITRDQVLEMASAAEIDTTNPWLLRGFLHALAAHTVTERARHEIEELVKSAQEFVQEGKVEEARSLVETLPDQPENILEFKGQLLGQIEELEQRRTEATQEVSTILRVLSAAGLDENQINEIARENNVDRSNVFQFQALLNAILEQAPPQVRAMLNRSEQRSSTPSDSGRWRFWKR